jgi:hypothetical protein
VLGSCRKSVAALNFSFENQAADRPLPGFPENAALWSPRIRIALKDRAFFTALLCLTLKRQAEDKRLDHTRPTGFRGERWGRSARKRPLRNYAARGLMCRELHDPLIRHAVVSIKTKNTFQTISFAQSLSTRFSTAFQEQR